jgi:hypothetical protein
MPEQKCKDLVAINLKSRIEDLKILWNLFNSDSESNDENLGNMYEYGLAFDYVAPNTFNGQRKGYFRYQLSWGGPSDEFRFFAHPILSSLDSYYSNAITRISGWELEKIEYWYLDWFDGANKKLTGKNLTLITEIFQSFFVDSESATNVYLKDNPDVCENDFDN